MAQLNVSFDDALLAEVDRLAAQRGINRPELLRALVREAIGAEGKP
jgi:metal-responsive CopG/Arc/MetJ family transcriptional regulator